MPPDTWPALVGELPDPGPCRRCGHSYDMHTHLRDGSDCGWCGRHGRYGCKAYQRRREPLLAPLMRLLRRR